MLGVRSPLVLAVALVACHSQRQPLPEETAHSEHFAYHSRPGDPLCAGTLAAAEAHLTSTLGYLRLDWPAGKKIDYYRYRDFEDITASSPCAQAHERCADASGGQGVVYTFLSLDQHELVHAYLAHVGFPNVIYAEGIADLFRCDSAAHARVSVQPSSWRRDLFSTKDGVWQSYPQASVLVRYLVERFGAERFLEAYARSKHGLGPDQFGAEFEQLFGTSLDEVWAEAGASRFASDVRAICACDGRELTTDGSDTPLTTCERDGTTEGVFTVSQPSLMFVEVASAFPLARNAPRACGTAQSPSPSFSVAGGNSGLRALTAAAMEPGRYYLAGVDELQLTGRDRDAPASCLTAPEYHAGPQHFYSTVTLPRPASGVSYFRFRFEAPQSLFFATAGIYVCPDCESAASPAQRCTPAAMASGAGKDVLGDLLLAVTPDADEASLTFNVAPCPPGCQGDRGKSGCPPYC